MTDKARKTDEELEAELAEMFETDTPLTTQTLNIEEE